MASGTIGLVNAGGNDYLVASTAYGTSSTAAATAAKVATIQSSAAFTLLTGITVHIKFTYANTASSITLNVNSTGAKTVLGNPRWNANTEISFTYDGTNWVTDKDAVLSAASSGTDVSLVTTGEKYTWDNKTSANDGALKLQKDSGTASSIFTANQSTDTTLKYTTTSVGSASGWSPGSTITLGTKIAADDITAWTTNIPTTPAVIDTTKFNGGSFTRGSFSGGSFTQGTDSFTANTPTVIDTTKFNGGKFTRGTFSGGSFIQGTDSFTPATLTMSGGGSSASSPSTLTITFSGGSFTQGVDSFTKATHGADSFTAASLSTGFYTAGTAASFTQGTDSFTAATHAADSFTAASLGSGFYTAGSEGSAASLSYTARSIPNVTSKGSTPSLTVSSTTVVNDITTD